MEAWVLLAVAAAAFQTARFAVQKSLTGAGLTASGATFARFVWSAPLALAAAWAWAAWSGQGLPAPPPAFWLYASLGGLGQILATVCVLLLFKRRHFAVGLTFKKSEVILTALLGLAVLGDTLTGWSAAALPVGLAGLVLLADPPDGGRGWGRLVNASAGLGLLSGVFFAVAAVGYRGASLSLPFGDVTLRALWSLGLATTIQTAMMLPWLLAREPGQIGAVLRGWRATAPVGLLSMGGSGCWFAAFTLQSAALVFAVGQVEVLFGMALGWRVFRERLGERELLGIALLTVSILTVALG